MASSKCPTCGTSNFTARFDLECGTLNDLLHSQSSPLDSTGVAGTISLIDNCASEIDRLQLQVEAFSSRLRQLKEYQFKLRSLVAPVRKLPNEVLMSIFNLVSQDNALREYPFLKNSPLCPDGEHGLITMPALVLSSVCSRWRQISLSYSALWSRMSLMLYVDIFDSEDSDTGLSTMVKLYINRSRTSLLRLRIDARGQFSCKKPRHLALSLLGQTTQRWQYLTFIGHNYFSRKIFSIPDNVHDFPNLQELEFDEYDRTLLKAFGQAPNLRHLEMTCGAIELTSNFPWPQLTSVALTGAEGLDKVMDRCPNLSSIRFQLYWRSPLSPLSHPPRAFPNIRSLSIILTGKSSDVNRLDIVLSSLICPSLTSLTFEGDSTSECAWPLRILESFLIRSSCVLANLSIRGLKLSDNDLVAVFKQLPSLTSLIVEDNCHMDSSSITSALIRSLHSASNPLLLPKLCHLGLTYAGKVFDDSGFVDMIQSRCISKADAQMTGIDPLRSLVLKSWNRTPTFLGQVADIYEPLKRLEEAGFMLIVKGVLG
ncbi:hypothetical protein BT96DRAFT_1017472 [Gymnopus androsaceus JB14]|uniref:Uncharacterized protein n=1 Tax=Gymnopus androsaceus JB14 TaxID=1447944 RepID=A0A6A4HYB8_9AGAR|nr:hypothetical protein BT96DRAFT_1017472 [Gymnopus androsaceus JB14]